jgi:hypothetical protein
MDTKENLKKWTSALRSGRFKQTVGALKINDGYCCLGVLCHIITEEQPNTRVIEKFNQILATGKDGKDQLGIIPEDLFIEWTGFPYSIHWTLSTMNDKGHSFFEIADYIETAANKEVYHD